MNHGLKRPRTVPVLTEEHRRALDWQPDFPYPESPMADVDEPIRLPAAISRFLERIRRAFRLEW